MTPSDHAAYARRAMSYHQLLPPALAAAPPRIARLGIPIALEKGAEAIVAPDIVARLARHKTALGVITHPLGEKRPIWSPLWSKFDALGERMRIGERTKRVRES
jgi:hypothetical protein